MDADLDVAIVGAGAAGLMAGIFAGRAARVGGSPTTKVAALDGAARVGAKILVSGGGRCNVTHDVVRPEDFHGGNRHQIAKVLRSFDAGACVRFFAERGVALKREPTGKLFPVSDRAAAVLDALLAALGEARTELRTACRVTGVNRRGEGFALDTSRGELSARRVVLATGGRSLPKTGSDGGGYALAQALGHTVTPTRPALVPLVLETGHWLTTLSGLSAEVALSLASSSGRVLRRERGPLLLTHFGLSGPVVLDMSRHWNGAVLNDPGARLAAAWWPETEFAAADARLVEEARRRPRASPAAALAEGLPQRLAEALVEKGAGLPSGATLGQLTHEARRRLVHALVALPLPVVRDRGYLHAEVTAGGVPLAEVDPATMASRRCPGLFLCGEILDVDGRIGGYNFQWAWASGRLAGMHAMGLTPSPSPGGGRGLG